MQARSATLAKDIEEKQTKLESLTQETDSLQRELDSNPVKRQAGEKRYATMPDATFLLFFYFYLCPEGDPPTWLLTAFLSCQCRSSTSSRL